MCSDLFDQFSEPVHTTRYGAPSQVPLSAIHFSWVKCSQGVSAKPVSSLSSRSRSALRICHAALAQHPLHVLAGAAEDRADDAALLVQVGHPVGEVAAPVAAPGIHRDPDPVCPSVPVPPIALQVTPARRRATGSWSAARPGRAELGGEVAVREDQVGLGHLLVLGELPETVL